MVIWWPDIESTHLDPDLPRFDITWQLKSGSHLTSILAASYPLPRSFQHDSHHSRDGQSYGPFQTVVHTYLQLIINECIATNKLRTFLPLIVRLIVFGGKDPEIEKQNFSGDNGKKAEVHFDSGSLGIKFFFTK